MLKRSKQNFAVRVMHRRAQDEQATLDAWSLHFGREAAALWLEALSVRDAAKLSNA